MPFAGLPVGGARHQLPHADLTRLGCYSGASFFRVQKDFVTQTTTVEVDRSVPLNARQQVTKLPAVLQAMIFLLVHSQVHTTSSRCC